MRKKGKTKKKIPKGITKNWSPPHAEIPNVKKSPPPKSFEIEILELVVLIPLKKR